MDQTKMRDEESIEPKVIRNKVSKHLGSSYHNLISKLGLTRLLIRFNSLARNTDMFNLNQEDLSSKGNQQKNFLTLLSSYMFSTVPLISSKVPQIDPTSLQLPISTSLVKESLFNSPF